MYLDKTLHHIVNVKWKLKLRVLQWMINFQINTCTMVSGHKKLMWLKSRDIV